MTPNPTPLAELVDLTGRTAVVTGAAAGIGAGIAYRLAEAGAAVLLADIDGEAAETYAKQLRELGFEASSVRVDVADEAEVERMADLAVERYGGIDVLVNNAGIFPSALLMDMTGRHFEHVVRVNLHGVFLCTRTVAQRMIARGRGGRIITITSIDALHPSSAGLAHYDASKHGAWGFTTNVALELAPHGITVNAIAPGAIVTPGTSQADGVQAHGGVDPEAMMRAFLARIPLRRMGEPDDIGRVALFLASDLSSYLTGSQIVVDGGALLS